MIAVLVIFTRSVVISNGLDILFKNLKVRIADEEPPYYRHGAVAADSYICSKVIIHFHF